MKFEVGSLDVTGKDLVAAVGLVAATVAIVEGVIARELYVTSCWACWGTIRLSPGGRASVSAEVGVIPALSLMQTTHLPGVCSR